MTDLYRVFTDDADLPDDGLLAVEMRNPDEKPRIRLVPVTIDYRRLAAEMTLYYEEEHLGQMSSVNQEARVQSARKFFAAAIGDAL